MSHRIPPVEVIRSAVLFGVGIGGIIYVTVTEQTERPTLLILFAAMIGLPAFLAMDRGRQKNNNNNNKNGR